MNYYLDEGAKAPTKAHRHDAGMDLYVYKFVGHESEKFLTIEPNKTYLIDTGLHVDIPIGCVGLVLPRSSSNVNGLLLHTGVIDSGYTGSIKLTVNTLNEPKVIKLNDRLAQLVVVPLFSYFSKDEVEGFTGNDRGDKGFGSSGS